MSHTDLHKYHIDIHRCHTDFNRCHTDLQRHHTDLDYCNDVLITCDQCLTIGLIYRGNIKLQNSDVPTVLVHLLENEVCLNGLWNGRNPPWPWPPPSCEKETPRRMFGIGIELIVLCWPSSREREPTGMHIWYMTNPKLSTLPMCPETNSISPHPGPSHRSCLSDSSQGPLVW